jgi:hypothetical protein
MDPLDGGSGQSFRLRCKTFRLKSPSTSGGVASCRQLGGLKHWLLQSSSIGLIRDLSTCTSLVRGGQWTCSRSEGVKSTSNMRMHVKEQPLMISSADLLAQPRAAATYAYGHVTRQRRWTCSRERQPRMLTCTSLACYVHVTRQRRTVDLQPRAAATYAYGHVTRQRRWTCSRERQPCTPTCTSLACSASWRKFVHVLPE